MIEEGNIKIEEAKKAATDGGEEQNESAQDEQAEEPASPSKRLSKAE